MKIITAFLLTMLHTLTYCQEPSVYLDVCGKSKDFTVKIYNNSKDTVYIRKDFSINLYSFTANQKCNTIFLNNQCHANNNDDLLKYICIMPFDSFIIQDNLMKNDNFRKLLDSRNKDEGFYFDTITSFVVEVYYLILRRGGILRTKSILFEGFYFENDYLYVRSHLCGIMRRVDQKTEVEIILPQKRKSTRIFKRKLKSR